MAIMLLCLNFCTKKINKTMIDSCESLIW